MNKIEEALEGDTSKRSRSWAWPTNRYRRCGKARPRICTRAEREGMVMAVCQRCKRAEGIALSCCRAVWRLVTPGIALAHRPFLRASAREQILARPHFDCIGYEQMEAVE
ncbi:MAG: hypothetical protein ACLVJ6_11435 [Merdibacter sp.]